MESRNAHLFRINCMPDLFVLFLSFVVVTSSPTKGAESIVDAMKKDANLCDNVKVLYESAYIKNCTTAEYPVQLWNDKENTLDQYLCLGVYDTAYKICQYSDHWQVPLDVAIFNSSVEKFVFNEKSLGMEEKYCKDNLQGFTSSSYEKIELYWGPLVGRLNEPHTCQRICFDFNFIFRPLCAVFAWIKSVEDEIKKSNAPVMYQNPVLDVLKAAVGRQLVNTKMLTEPKEAVKKSEVKVSKEQPHDKLKNVSNSVTNEHMQPNTEKVDSDVEKSNKHETQKTLNGTSPKMVDHNPREKGKENISDIKVETNAEAPIVANNMPSNENVNTKEDVKEANAEETDRKPEVENTKTSTLSENTQDHYGAGNADDDLGGEPLEDVNETLQQPEETANQNENLQETIEQKNPLQYPNMRTEGDSHFFTYFTIITVACIACYIGYHNKQKILAIVLEGRRSRNSRGRRRPSTASYRKLDCTLEEAVTSQCNANVTHVIY